MDLAVYCRPRSTKPRTPMSSTKRAALYVRVSTDAQTVENQIRELRQVAKRRGWDVVEVYSDAGISGAKGRNRRPGLDSMLQGRQQAEIRYRHGLGDSSPGPLVDRPTRHDPAPRRLRGGLVLGPTGDRHDDPDGQARFSR